MANNQNTHLVVDMLYDFIDGSMACKNAENAVAKSIEYINAHPSEKVLYICDSHPQDHSSFKEFGGLWPVHCVKGTRGGSIHEKYFSLVNKENRPCNNNIFAKGCDKTVEQYSGYEAANEKNECLNSVIEKNITVSGIATEYCVKNTVKDLIENGFKVSVIKEALAYIDEQGHEKSLEDMKTLGAKII